MINKSDLFSKCLQTLTTSLHLCPGPSRQHLFLDWCGGLLTGLHDSSILTLLHSSELSRQSSAFKMCFKKSHPDTTLHKTLRWHPISFKIKPNFLIIYKVYAMSLWPHLFLFFSSFSLLVVPSGWNAYPRHLRDLLPPILEVFTWMTSQRGLFWPCWVLHIALSHFICLHNTYHWHKVQFTYLLFIFGLSTLESVGTGMLVCFVHCWSPSA